MSAALAALATLVEAPPPWWAPYANVARQVSAAAQPGGDVAQALDAVAVATGVIRFVDHRQQGDGQAYESFIARHGAVPTRDNLHDLFNGLVWLRFPRVKHYLNRLHAAQIEQGGVASQRGPVRDALTLFDENGAWLPAPAVLNDALQRRDWRALFIDRRAAWHDTAPVLFGHALLEKLLQPRKPITAHVWVVPQASDAEQRLCRDLTPERLAAKPFAPLPVLGVPGWWSANESPAFYDDPGVFRAPRG